MAQSSIVNTSYVRPDRQGLKVGLHATKLFHPKDKVERYGLLLGGKTAVADVATGQLTEKYIAKKNASVIWAHSEAPPVIEHVRNNDVIHSLGIITLGRETFLVRQENVADGSCIVEIETGFFGELNLAELQNMELFPHGSFALNPGSELVGMQESLGDEVLGFPTERGLAKRLRWRVEKDVPSTLIPFHRYDVWKILPGGQVIVQGINGESFRLVCERRYLIRRVDMPNGHDVFEGYEAGRLQRKADRAKKVIPATPADVAALPAPEDLLARPDVPAEPVKPEKKGWFW